MPQSSHNPEKEPTPERKWWNIFERQTEFEEPEKDKQPEKQAERAKELKSAAKERGHFWESFMPHREGTDDSEEIAPKGEKVRKKWRALLRRKSEKQVEEFKREDPEVVDSYWLAQLMVAERILTLHTHLAESEPKTEERRQIKTELDVLGLLSEKLSDPEIDVPVEIEETYQAIVSVLDGGEHTLGVEEHELPVIKDVEASSEQPVETREHSFQKYGIAVVVAVKLAVQNKKQTPDVQLQPEPVTPYRQGGGTTTATPTLRGDLNPLTPPTPGRGYTEPLRSPSSDKTSDTAPTPHQTPNMAPGILLTSAVILAEYNDRNDEKRSYEQPTSYDSPLSIQQPSTHTESRTSPDPEISEPIDRTNVEAPANVLELTQQQSIRKFEHMNIIELLQIAQSVPLGNGEYLARAYQSGKIDRDGLIRVLKAAGRNGNYRDEYRRSSTEYLRLRPRPLHTTSQSGVHIAADTALPVRETTQGRAIGGITHDQPSSKLIKPTIITQAKPIFSLKTVTILCLVIIALTLLVLL